MEAGNPALAVARPVPVVTEVVVRTQAVNDIADANRFADFANPLAFAPQWRPPAQIPRLPWPTDPTAALLWLVSEKVAPARPWLPTVAEQDAAWRDKLGEAQQMRASRHRDAVAIGARIGA